MCVVQVRREELYIHWRAVDYSAQYRKQSPQSELARHTCTDNIVGESKNNVGITQHHCESCANRFSGTHSRSKWHGKELIANFLHKNSYRKDMQFVALNCASIPENLLESELFGHEKGAFTDAMQWNKALSKSQTRHTLPRRNRRDQFNDSTKTLTFPSNREYRRVGGNKNLKSDVRVISATNKNLHDEVGTGDFSWGLAVPH